MTGGFPETVLIVDDDPILSVVVEAFFRKRGSTNILRAGHGVEALEILDRSTAVPGFVLCDLNMPQMDGVSFLRHLRDRDFHCPIAILSGEKGDVVKSASNLAAIHNLNIVGALRKPLNIKELEDVVLKALNRPEHQTRMSGEAPELTSMDLTRLLQEERVVPFFQPKLNLTSKQVSGLEALARLHHPDFGLLAPGRFVEKVEALGLMPIFTRQMIVQSLRVLYGLERQGYDLRMSINVTPVELNDLEFPNRLSRLVEEACVSPSRVILEVTESTLLKKTAEAAETLTRLRIMGFRISIDDFGTGFSNMEQLRQYPFSELKIDQSFVREALTDKFAQACVDSSVRFARELGLHVVAEGVETEEQFNYIVRAGADEVQGFFIAKPMQYDDLVPWLEQHKRAIDPKTNDGLQRAV